MHSHREEILCAGLFVETHQMIRVPLLRLPDVDQIFVSDLGWMTICLAVVQVLRLALYVHVTGIPVAIFNRGLRSPMRPDAALRIAKPVWNLVSLQVCPGGEERSALGGLLRAGKLPECEGGAGDAQRLKHFSAIHLHEEESIPAWSSRPLPLYLSSSSWLTATLPHFPEAISA